MSKVHTHYDNLKVTRNAPPEVIRAAYKSLSQKFHPDRNPGDPGSTRTFQIINTAYEVLSDPLKRREHDDWIAGAEAQDAFASSPHMAPPGLDPQPMPHPSNAHAGMHAHSRHARHDWADSIRRMRPGSALRQASGYLFLSAVATLVFLGIMLG
jgi:curved DNA-binding protein CbpA